jgi:carbon monoxide dehydrogenase subunit G
VVSPALYRVKMRVQLGPIKAEFNLDVEILSETTHEEVRTRTRGEEGGRASSLMADSTLRLTSLSEGRTEVLYSSEASVVGRLGKFGLSVMQKKAESLGREFAAAFKQRIETTGAAG